MLPRVCLPALILCLSVSLAAGQTIEASAVAQPLLSDLSRAQGLLDANQSPWQEPGARPQAEPLAVVREALSGNRIWVAFKPVDRAVRRAYWLQQQSYLEKDAAVRQRREAQELLPALAEAIRADRDCYPRSVTNLAARQIAQVDNALKHLEYHAALCVLWSMADMLGLWDRQAALEVAQDHLADLCHSGAGKPQLPEKVARRMSRKVEVIAQIIAAALAWRPPADSIGPVELGPARAAGSRGSRHFADHADLGAAFDPWRDNWAPESGATPLVFDETSAGYALSMPARETRCLHARPQYHDWQRTLHDYRYGWSVYQYSSAQQKPGCDWRKLEPWATWPGAKGAPISGGL
jgi:hypothetical protein